MIAPEILEKQATTEWIPVSDINIDTTYQRHLSTTKVQAISAHFNEVAAGTLAVSLRDNGQYYAMDGRHRLAAMKKRGILLAECKVCRGLTVEQEAEIFIFCNTVRKTPDALDVFRARLVAKDPVAEAINGVVERCGLSIQFSFSTISHGKRPLNTIWAVTAMEDIYKQGKERLLAEVLTLAHRSWPEEGDALKAYILLGTMRFHLKYQGKYSREEFIAKMQVTDLKSLSRRAQYHAESSGGSIYTAFAKALQEAYDKGKKTRRLESK